jgi:hypothetical protein
MDMTRSHGRTPAGLGRLGPALGNAGSCEVATAGMTAIPPTNPF